MSQMLLVSDNDQLSSILIDIFSHYFPSKLNNNIHIENKYYTCSVQIHKKQWDQQIDNVRYDFLIMLTQGTNPISSNIIDNLIEQHQPSSFILIANSKLGQNHYNNPLKDSVAQCNNFIQVVIEDLKRIIELKPIWKQTGLLDQFDQMPIFSLFDLLHTTPWTNMNKRQTQKIIKKQEKIENKNVVDFNEKKQFQESKINQKTKKQNQQKMNQQSVNPQKVNQQKVNQQNLNQQILNQQNNVQTEQQQNYHQNEEQNEEQLERQMIEFESIMAQMAALKTASIDDDNRKIRVQNIFKRLTKDMI